MAGEERPGACSATVPVTIRDAELADMARLQDVFRRASLSNVDDRDNLLAHPEVLEYSDEWVRRGCTRVATHDGEIRGFATVVHRQDVFDLEDLFVEPDWMRRGIARALVDDIVARARTTSMRRLDVIANPHALGVLPSGRLRRRRHRRHRLRSRVSHASRHRTVTRRRAPGSGSVQLPGGQPAIRDGSANASSAPRSSGNAKPALIVASTAAVNFCRYAAREG